MESADRVGEKSGNPTQAALGPEYAMSGRKQDISLHSGYNAQRCSLTSGRFASNSCSHFHGVESKNRNRTGRKISTCAVNPLKSPLRRGVDAKRTCRDGREHGGRGV